MDGTESLGSWLDVLNLRLQECAVHIIIVLQDWHFGMSPRTLEVSEVEMCSSCCLILDPTLWCPEWKVHDINFPSMQWGFPARCRMGAGLILLPPAAIFCGVPSSSTFPPVLAPITEPAISGPLPQSHQTYCAQDKTFKSSWGLPRLYN